jgi:PilZ domain-containing protein
MRSGIQIRGQTKDLSLFGCSVDATNPFPQGTRVSIKISHGSLNFESFGRVAYARPDLGMGMVFISVEPESEQILEWWIADLARGLNSR